MENLKYVEIEMDVDIPNNLDVQIIIREANRMYKFLPLEMSVEARLSIVENHLKEFVKQFVV